VSVPPVHARFSDQTGGAYPPPAGIGVVDRDNTDLPDPTAYSICYINAFQAQAPDLTGTSPWLTRLRSAAC
jgi:hypothetical protein